MKFTFVAETHEDYGELGWRQYGKPGFDPLPGMAVAHDCLEHFRDGDDSIADELKALGAAIYVRGESGWFHERGVGNPDAAANLASDMPDILRHAIYEGMPIDIPRGSTLPIDDAEYIVQQTVQETRKLIRSEFDEDVQREHALTIARFLSALPHYLRIGYRRARHRYANVYQHDVAYMFTQIMDGANKWLTRATEGDLLTVSVNIRRCEVSFTLRDGLDGFRHND